MYVRSLVPFLFYLPLSPRSPNLPTLSGYKSSVIVFLSLRHHPLASILTFHFLSFKCVHKTLMSRQPKLCPKSQIPGFSEGVSDLGTVVPLSGFEASQAPAEAKRHHRIFRVKRKHVLKACDRCRVKKTKVSCLFNTLLPSALSYFLLNREEPTG